MTLVQLLQEKERNDELQTPRLHATPSSELGRDGIQRAIIQRTGGQVLHFCS